MNPQNRYQESAIHLFKWISKTPWLPAQKAAAFVNHKGTFKEECSHMQKHMFYFASANEASVPPLTTPKYLGNIPAMCVYPLWILSHCYCFCYTFSITSCCFPPTQLRTKRKKESLCLAIKGPIYCIWKPPHQRQFLRSLHSPCTCLT